MGGTLDALLADAAPEDLGPGPGSARLAVDLVLDRVHNFLVIAMGRMMAGEDGVEMLSLARLAATVAPDAPQAGMCAAVLALLDQHQAYVAELSFGDGEPRFPGIHLLVVAAGLARTPDVPVPAPA